MTPADPRPEGEKKEAMKLYRVKCRGNSSKDCEAYVVAPDAGAAYERLRAFLNAHDLCFTSEREMASVELLADEAMYPECERRLLFKEPV